MVADLIEGMTLNRYEWHKSNSCNLPKMWDKGLLLLFPVNITWIWPQLKGPNMPKWSKRIKNT